MIMISVRETSIGARRRNRLLVVQASALLLLSVPLVTNAWLSPSERRTASFPSTNSDARRFRPLQSRDGDEYDEEEDYDDDDDPPSVDVSDFVPPTMSYGLNKGRSSPSQRKAMGVSGSSTARIHICTSCGSEFVKWMGRCPTCKEWNTLQEHVVARQSAAASQPYFGRSGSSTFGHPRRPSWLEGTELEGVMIGSTPIRITDLYNVTERSGDGQTNTNRRRQRIEIPEDFEFNTVLGGGIMQGSLTLLGGDPGVGKSTLLLQIAGCIASLAAPTPAIGMGKPTTNSTGSDLGPVWYVSGEENPDQIASRAARLGIVESELYILSETHADSLCEQLASQLRPSSSSVHLQNPNEDLFRKKPPSLVIIDSIQTMVCNQGGASSAGGVTQVRECVALLLRLAKSTGIPVFLVGHVTKTGDVAGPRTVEHMVDCVLYLEGVDNHGMNIRMLRASKNRFGSTSEVGVYEMTSGRLLPVSDPSSLFLAHRVTEDDSEGCAIAIALEGMRAMTVEVQALVTPAGGNAGFGRRTVNGIAYNRLLLILGVLQKRCGVFLARQDVFINVVGRIRLDRGEGNAADLAVAIALVSSLASIPVRADTAFVGEVGLLGELRNVEALQKRLSEARRMGFSRVVTPREAGKNRGKGRRDNQRTTSSMVNGIEWIQCETLLDAMNAGLVSPLPKRTKRKKVAQSEDEEVPGSLQDLGLTEIMDDEEDDPFL